MRNLKHKTKTKLVKSQMEIDQIVQFLFLLTFRNDNIQYDCAFSRSNICSPNEKWIYSYFYCLEKLNSF